VQQLQLDPGEVIANSFSMDGVDAYIVSTKKLYRLRAGADNVPDGTLYADGYGGIFAMRDSRWLGLPVVRRP
jgi:hypothetical protein